MRDVSVGTRSSEAAGWGVFYAAAGASAFVLGQFVIAGFLAAVAAQDWSGALRTGTGEPIGPTATNALVAQTTTVGAAIGVGVAVVVMILEWITLRRAMRNARYVRSNWAREYRRLSSQPWNPIAVGYALRPLEHRLLLGLARVCICLVLAAVAIAVIVKSLTAAWTLQWPGRATEQIFTELLHNVFLVVVVSFVAGVVFAMTADDVPSTVIAVRRWWKGMLHGVNAVPPTPPAAPMSGLGAPRSTGGSRR